MLLNSLTRVGAILIENCTSAHYRPGHWLLSDVTPESQTLEGAMRGQVKWEAVLEVICIYGSGVMSSP